MAARLQKPKEQLTLAADQPPIRSPVRRDRRHPKTPEIKEKGMKKYESQRIRQLG